MFGQYFHRDFEISCHNLFLKNTIEYNTIKYNEKNCIIHFLERCVSMQYRCDELRPTFRIAELFFYTDDSVAQFPVHTRIVLMCMCRRRHAAEQTWGTCFSVVLRVSLLLKALAFQGSLTDHSVPHPERNSNIECCLWDEDAPTTVNTSSKDG